MVAVPGVGNGLFRVRREERRLVKRAHRVVCFSAAELVKGLVVHVSSRPSALFPSDDHPASWVHLKEQVRLRRARCLCPGRL